MLADPAEIDRHLADLAAGKFTVDHITRPADPSG